MLSKTNKHRTMQPMVILLKIIHYKTIHGTPLETISRPFYNSKCYIFSLKQAFPTSFDTVGNMPGKYSIKIDTTVPPVQHARHKVLIHYKEEIERKCLEMEQLQIIAPVTTPREWVSSITYPTKQDGSLRICLDPHNLKAIIREHYKAPTLEEISHRLSGTTVFSKMDAKMVSGVYT